VLAFFDAFFLFGFGGFLLLSLLAPSLARIVLPLVITLLEIVRLLVLFVQYLVDELLIHSLIKSFQLPRVRRVATQLPHCDPAILIPCNSAVLIQCLRAARHHCFPASLFPDPL
jgi:hypothetical protein